MRNLTKNMQGVRYSGSMKITVYHEVDPSSREEILDQGIDRESEGQKMDTEKRKVDEYLDTHLPLELDALDISRDSVVYAYMAHEGNIIDISDGEFIPIDEFNDRSEQTLLKLTVESKDCYVSDLDLYDTLMRAMELGEQDGKLQYLAFHYWESIVPYDKYEMGSIRRPEVMIANDIRPGAVEIVE